MARRRAADNTAQPHERRPVTPNFGSVDLNLPPDWSRRAYRRGDNLVNLIVGHEGGVPDLALKDHPERKHQFCWGDPKNERDLTRKFQAGYDFVTDAAWVKNTRIWFWRDGRVWTQGMVAMARPESAYLEDKERRDQHMDVRDRNAAAFGQLQAKAEEIMRKHGVSVNLSEAFPSDARLVPMSR